MSSPLGLTQSFSKYNLSYNNGSNDNSNEPYKSIINNGKFYYRPGGGATDSKTKYSANNTNTSVHRVLKGGEDIYDISLDSILRWSEQQNVGSSNIPGTSLKASDFIYLKDLGVYPNNRLMIARRFSSPVPNDLNLVNFEPISKVISWVGDKDDLFSFSFGENWTNGENSIKDIINTAIDDNKAFGRFGSSAKGITERFTPNGGYMDGFRQEFLKAMGFTDAGSDNLPVGNPNLIQESSMRKVPGEDGGSSLECSFSIKFTTTYELKFIKGIDPNIVYLDILQNVLRFGTSEAQFYLRGDLFKSGSNADKFFKGIRDNDYLQSIKSVINSISDTLKGTLKNIKTLFETNDEGGIVEKVKIGSDAILGVLNSTITTFSDSIISKYKVRFISVISALTGEPSAPWHITIGNPKKPFFSSGDMIAENISISFGSKMFYNDLPDTIKIEFTMKNARNLGLSEILDRFNPGAGRSYVTNVTIDDPTLSLYEQKINTETVLGLNDDTKSSKTDTRGNTIQNESNSVSKGTINKLKGNLGGI